jgi:DNA-binding FadR family transcriptional regulator
MGTSIRRTEQLLGELRPELWAHLQTVQAIERGKPDEARQAMIRHMKLGQAYPERLECAGP